MPSTGGQGHCDPETVTMGPWGPLFLEEVAFVPVLAGNVASVLSEGRKA